MAKEAMNVRELIGHLSKIDPDMQVYYHDYDGRSALTPLSMQFVYHRPGTVEEFGEYGFDWDTMPFIHNNYTVKALVMGGGS